MNKIDKIIKEEIRKAIKENFEHLDPKTLGDVVGTGDRYDEFDKLFASDDLLKMSPENLDILARKVKQDPELLAALKELVGSFYDMKNVGYSSNKVPGGYSKLSNQVGSLKENFKQPKKINNE